MEGMGGGGGSQQTRPEKLLHWRCPLSFVYRGEGVCFVLLLFFPSPQNSCTLRHRTDTRKLGWKLHRQITELNKSTKANYSFDGQWCTVILAQAICTVIIAQAICPVILAQAICTVILAQAICPVILAQAICTVILAQAICTVIIAQAICPVIIAQAIYGESVGNPEGISC